VIDIRQPALPVQVAHLETTGRALQVAVSGPHAVIVDGGYYTDQGYRGTGVEVIDVHDPATPQRVGRIDTVGRVRALAVSGDLAGVVDEGTWSGLSQSNYFSVIELSGPGGPRRVGQYRLFDVEVALALVGNRAYLARDLGLEVIDLTNPARPRRLGETWLDGDVWGFKRIAVSGSKVFVVSATGVAVLDISNPSAPIQTGWHRGTRSGNRFAGTGMSGMAISGSHLYRTTEGFSSMFAADNGSLLEVLDVSNANHPALTATYPVGIDARGLALSGSLAFVASGFTGMQILDVADPAQPRLLSSYLEQSDSVVGTVGVAVARRTACVLGSKGFDTVDIAEPKQPRGLGQYRLGEDESTAGISAAGNRAYLLVQGPSQSLEVIDLSNPVTPQRLIRYDTESWSERLPASPHFAYVPDVEEGWLIQDVRDPANPALVGGYRTIASVLGATILGTQAHNVSGGIYDVSDPGHPRQIGWADPGDGSRSVSRSGDLVCAVGTQGLQCYDVSDPANARLVGRFATSHPATGIILRGTDAFVTAGPSGLLVVDLSRPAASIPTAIEFTPVPLSSGGSDARGVAASGDLAYVADGGSGLKILDMRNAEEPMVLGEHGTDDFAYGVAVAGDYVFLAAGNAGMEVFEAKDPAQPRRASRIPTATRAQDVVVDGGYAYVVLEGQWSGATNVFGGGLDVIDVRDPVSPRRVGGFETDGLVAAAVVVGNRAFLAGMSDYRPYPWLWWRGGVDVLDLTLPTQPRRVGRFETSGPAVAVAYAEGIVGVVGRGVWTGSEWVGGNLALLDVTDPANPRKLGEYPLGSGAADSPNLVMTGHYACLVLPSLGGLHIVDLSDPAHPRRVNQLFSLGTARDLAVSGTRLFAAAGGAGVKVVDITAPSRPRWLGGFSVGGGMQEVVCSTCFAVAPSWENGLQVLDLTDPARPRRARTYVTQSPVSDVALAGRMAYLAEMGDRIGYEQVGGRLSVVDMADPTHPRRVGACELDGPALAVAVSGQRACLALGFRGMELVDISNPTAPRSLGDYDTGGYAWDVAMEGNYAFVADGSHGLQVIDLSDPPVLRRIGGHTTGGAATRVAVSGRRAFVGDDRVGLLAFDVSDPANPRLLDRLARAPEGNGYGYGSVSFPEGYACVVDPSGLRVLDLWDPDRPRLIADQSSVPPGSTVTLERGYLYLHSEGLQVAELPPHFRSITHVGGETRLEWEGWGGARLEGTASLTAPDWHDLGIPESANSATLPLATPHAFFRLRRP
jgi:hypothetical protein